MRHSIDVTVYPAGEAGVADDPGIEFKGVSYISLVNSGTYGPPALIVDTKDGPGKIGERILYVSPENIVAMEAIRHE